jgi:eukaryotic-like serine/threonine-protein kinase
MAVNPDDRYPSPKHLAGEVERYLADEPVQALPESVLTRLSRWARRNRHWVQAGSIALALITATAISAYFYQRETAAQNLKLAMTQDSRRVAEPDNGSQGDPENESFQG